MFQFLLPSIIVLFPEPFRDLFGSIRYGLLIFCYETKMEVLNCYFAGCD
jgi:hypothetical protein